MMLFSKRILLVLLLAFCQITVSQNETDATLNTLSFEEYLSYVKMHHPIVKQANITLNMGEANLLRARGGFDPKVEVDYDRKKFKNTEYFDQLNATFKIPTWYGVEFKANFEENTGVFLDPSLTVPENGLYSAGVSFSLAQGLLMNDRMADLKKARYFNEQSKADRELIINDLVYEASTAYFDWVIAVNEQGIYESFLVNATIRLNGVRRGVEVGENASIDSTEARITVLNRQLNLEAAKLKSRKAALVASNFLWINQIPLEIETGVRPKAPETAELSSALYLEDITNLDQADLQNHPKLRSLEAKIKGLQVDRSLKRNKLLPKIDLQYNFLSQDYDAINRFNTASYKAFVNFSVPLFLRKERGDAKLANYKLSDARYERQAATLTIQNKISATQAEIESLLDQSQLIEDIVVDYTRLVAAEDRKFSLGESSLFLINSREQKLIEATLKQNELLGKSLEATASFFNALGVSEPYLTN